MARVLVTLTSMYTTSKPSRKRSLKARVASKAPRSPSRRVPELMPEDVARRLAPRLDQAAPIATWTSCPLRCHYLGTPTRLAICARRCAIFFNQTGRLWLNGSLIWQSRRCLRVHSTQHGGQETTITSFRSTLLHQGMIIVGVPYSCQEILNMSEITGGSPYGASTLAGGDGSPSEPSENEIKIARFQGAHVAQVARKLSS